MIGMGILFNEVENSFQEKSVDPIMYYEYCGFKWYILLCIKRGRQTRQTLMDKLRINKLLTFITNMKICTTREIYEILFFISILISHCNLYQVLHTSHTVVHEHYT